MAAPLAAVLAAVVNAGDNSENKVIRPAAESYRRFPSISFDHAVMEKTDAARVVVADNLGWSDIGSWATVAQLSPADDAGNRVAGDTQLHDCADTFIAAADKLVVGVGLRKLHIVDSADALLVAAADKSENIRAAYDALAAAKRDEALLSPTMRRPWGSYTVLAEGAGYKVKRIDVLPGGTLSLQSHQHRSEHWTTIAGTMRVVINECEFDMPVDHACHIPLGAKHRMSNNGGDTAAIIEVQIGDYLGEDDITRYEDIYGRA